MSCGTAHSRTSRCTSCFTTSWLFYCIIQRWATMRIFSSVLNTEASVISPVLMPWLRTNTAGRIVSNSSVSAAKQSPETVMRLECTTGLVAVWPFEYEPGPQDHRGRRNIKKGFKKKQKCWTWSCRFKGPKSKPFGAHGLKICKAIQAPSKRLV